MEILWNILLLIVGIANAVLVAILLSRKPTIDTQALKSSFDALEKAQEHLERLLRDEISKNRQETNSASQQSREELQQNLNTFGNSLLSRLAEHSSLQKNQLDSFTKQLTTLTQMNEQKLEKVRSVVEERLKSLQAENSERLEKMRETVDEKLHSTLEKRLGESFQLVSERLEKVHQGLGEMQHLASGVGDLKKILANVKTRGTWGEVQLGNLLEQILTPEQFERNVITKKGSRDPVEFAIKLPGNNGNVVFLPIDAKFPTQDYERLQEAQEQSNLALIEEATKAVEQRIKLEAKNIRDKYIDPPHTTDFGILFLPTEGLYAEVLRRSGLSDTLRQDFRVIVTGPTTLAALLNSLQLGFRTLAVEKRASEVWSLLGVVKTEFGKFATILESTQTKLRQASDTIEDAARKSRTIERKLKDVQDLPAIAHQDSARQLIEEKGNDTLFD